MEFREILKQLRLENGLTHETLAERINVSKAIIGFWESGKYEPTAKSLIQLSKFFKVSTDYLLGLENAYGGKIEQSTTISNSFNHSNNITFNANTKKH